LAYWPAVDVVDAGDQDLALAVVDDCSPTALEPLDESLRLFFATSPARDAAHAALMAAGYHVRAIDVDDEDWARRSQENLGPITVGQITVISAPLHSAPLHPAPLHPAPLHPAPLHRAPLDRSVMTLVIQPSMGFGTGHHATTRLCLRGLQMLDLTNRSVLDVGTGSGILALAAARLGAAAALGIDCDADAVQAAGENLALNAGSGAVRFRVASLDSADLPSADVVLANLTGALLTRSARRLLALLRPAGSLIVSGLLEDEHEQVRRAFPGVAITWEAGEAGWMAIAMKRS
jgi:ribosomal protein L11 methyltransferase